MTARPWMPLYIADYLADTGHLSTLEHGAYLLLIMHYWQHSRLPVDDAALARVARMNAKEWQRAKPNLAALFQNGWRHKRIDTELAHAVEISGKRRAAALQKRSNRTPKAGAIAGQKETQPQSQEKKEEKEEEVFVENGAGARTSTGFTETELALLELELPAVRVREELPGLAEWCDNTDIVKPNERKRAILGALRKKQKAAEGGRKLLDLREEPIPVSPELAARMARQH